ncbi:T9SS type A sorting domain-containing protein [candidate division KSB1 bacterium]|nr:T9SS type A sorting domain-containing protein [candidate division KSB1 bacterium]
MNVEQNIRCSLIFVCYLILTSYTALAQSVNLAWNPATGNISHFNIYRTTHVDSSFRLLDIVDYPDTVYLDITIKPNSRYYYVATSVTFAGEESGFSNVIDTLISSSVPVEISAFSGTVVNGAVVLQWSTVSESNNYGFDVQRFDSIRRSFNKIGFIAGHGTTSEVHHYTFIDADIHKTSYIYRLKQIDTNGTCTLSDPIHVDILIAGTFQLKQNNPNPFNQSTRISYILPISGNVQILIYNVYGQKIIELVNEFQNAGQHTFIWNGLDDNGLNVASGLYYYKLQAFNSAIIRKMMLAK